MSIYIQKLHSIPAPGKGCHTALLGVANCGIYAGLSEVQIFEDIRQHIPNETRYVPDSEIYAAISKAKRDYIPYRSIFEKPFKNSVSKPKIPSGYRDHLIEKGKGIEEVDFWEASPVRLFDAPEKDTELFLRTLYKPDACLFIGTQYDTKVRTVAQWIDLFKKHPTLLPFICPNPVDGQPHRTKSGTLSYRCDEAVCKFKFAVLEFDTLSRNEQFAFWGEMLNVLPVVALIDSGNKSLHAWIHVPDVHTLEEWKIKIEQKFFEQCLKPLGIDTACKNPSHMSRLPGCIRKETGRWQRLLYLNPEARLGN